MDELTLYTCNKTDELIKRNNHENRNDICVFCHDKHKVVHCKLLPWMDAGNSKDPSKGCIICDNPYHTTDCKWIQIVNLTRSLTPSYQKELERVCPYLKQYIERIEKKFYYTAMWKFWEEQV